MKIKMINKGFAYFLVVLLAFPGFNLHAQETTDITVSPSSQHDKTWITLRLGQGGFRDSRSELNQLGGGQLALDVRPRNLPVIFSLSGEYYTNSAEPTHPYEISDMIAFNVLYVSPLLNSKKADYFLGGGIGRLKVPKSENEPGARVDSNLYNLEAGIHLKPYKYIGFYGLYKYLYANKDVNNIKLVDFSEHIILLGVTFTFGI